MQSTIQATEADMHNLRDPASIQGHVQANVHVAICFGIHMQIATCAMAYTGLLGATPIAYSSETIYRKKYI